MWILRENVWFCKNDASSHGPTRTQGIELFVSAHQYSIDNRIHTRQCLWFCDHLYWRETAASSCLAACLSSHQFTASVAPRVYTYRVINKQTLAALFVSLPLSEHKFQVWNKYKQFRGILNATENAAAFSRYDLSEFSKRRQNYVVAVSVNMESARHLFVFVINFK